MAFLGDHVVSTSDRRALISDLGVAAVVVVVAVLVAGAVLFAVWPSPAGAAADVEEFDVEGDEITITEDGEVHEVWLTMIGTVEWWDFQQLDGGEIEIWLEGPADGEQTLLGEPIAFEYDDGIHGPDNSPEAGLYEWEGDLPILEQTEWTGEDLAPAPGESESTEMTVHLDVELTDDNGETVTVQASDTFTVTVDREAADPQLEVQFGGHVEISGDEADTDDD